MIEYLILLMPVFLAVLTFRRHAGVYVAVSCYVTLIAGLRLDVGFDYPSYVAIFNQTIESDLEFASELIMQASQALGHSQFYFLLTSTLTVGCIATALWRYSRDPLLAFWVFMCMPYMFLVSLSVIRQYTAIALGFFLLSQYARLGLLRLLPLLSIVGLLHTSAIVLLPLAFFWRVLARPLPAWLMLGSLPLFYILSDITREILIDNIPFYTAHFGEGDNGYKLYILYVLVLFLMLVFRRRANLDSDASRYLNLFYVGLVLFSLTVNLSEAAARISYYFLIFIAPLLDRYVDCFRPRALARAMMMCILLLLFLLQLSISSSNPVKDQYIPYQMNGNFLFRSL